MNRTYQIGAGERILTEISCKFDLDKMLPYLEDFGLLAKRIYTDSNKRFAVLLLERG
jgi:L-histidine N-alpha-methyltransferase